MKILKFIIGLGLCAVCLFKLTMMNDIAGLLGFGASLGTMLFTMSYYIKE